MAKGVKRVLGVSSLLPDYREPNQLPWREIEETLRRPIPDKHRAEIFKAREDYFGMRAAFTGVPLEHVKKLRRRLFKLCGEIHSMKNSVDDAYTYRAIEGNDEYAQKLLGKDAGPSDINSALDGLEWQQGCDVRGKFDSLAAACLELIKVLNKPTTDIMVTGAETSDAMAFDYLYGVLAKAAPTWDFKPTENSPDFVKLVAWMIGLSDYNKAKNKIKNARAKRKARISAADK